MTRLQQELSGALGAFWQGQAEAELAKVKADLADSAATQAARAAEVEADLESYRAARRATSGQEMAEMRTAFGEGAKVVNVLTGEMVQL